MSSPSPVADRVTFSAVRRPFRFGVQTFRATSASEWIERVKKAEALGYAVLTMPDHAIDQLAPIPSLAAAASATKSIRLGTMVMSNDWRNPVLLAREAATLDWLSEGRLEFGVGAGWLAEDYERLGVDFDPPGVRIERMSESLGLMIRLLSGETVTHVGKYYRASGATCYPLPIQKPHPPMVVGGGSRRILSLAGRVANIVNVFTNIGAGQRGNDARPDWGDEATSKRIEWVREAAGDRFREIELSARIQMAAITDTPSRVAGELGSRFHLGEDDVQRSPYALVGSVASISEQLIARRERFGFSSYVWNEDDLETMAPVVQAMAGR